MVKLRKQPKREDEDCYLCGSPAESRDHIPPRGLFPTPRPSNLLTVPACLRCNHDRSLDDEYFRLIVSAGSQDSPQSTVLLHQRIIPRMREKPALALDFLKSFRPVAIHNEGGVHMGNEPVFTFDRTRIQTVIDKIVRGLFFKHAKHRLADDYLVEEFYYCPPIEASLQQAILELPLINIGDGAVFSYRYHIASEGSSESFWFLMFYNDTSLFVTRTIRSII